MNERAAPITDDIDNEEIYKLAQRFVDATRAGKSGLEAVGWPRDLEHAIRVLCFALVAKRHAPIPMLLWCPMCHMRHIDQEMSGTPHASHSCQHCGLTWKPAKVPTVGVQFLPGYKDAEPPPPDHSTVELDAVARMMRCDPPPPAPRCECPPGSHEPYRIPPQGRADGPVCSLGWPVRS